jgi:hypothetical protein
VQPITPFASVTICGWKCWKFEGIDAVSSFWPDAPVVHVFPPSVERAK